jgi:hypothetical protein
MNSKIQNKLYLVILGFLLQNIAIAQMYVGPNTNVYVKDQVVFVKQKLELKEATSNFYLRKESQLVQGTDGSGANSGLGNLSVFQEGSVNNFSYNYWCSPVGNVVTSTLVNNPFGITQLGVPSTSTVTTATQIAPGFDGVASPFSISTRWIYKFPSNSTYSGWVQVGSASNINAGEGFTMKGSSETDTTLTPVDGVQNNPGSSQRYDFRGKPNDGTIDIPVVVDKLTLTGNPYPSAIDLKLFLDSEPNCTGSAYFWEQDKTVNSHYVADYKGGYGTYSPIGVPDGTYVPATYFSYDGAGNQLAAAISLAPAKIFKRRYSPIGQGFMIRGNSTIIGLPNVQMKNIYRVYKKEGALNNSLFEKRANYKTSSTEIKTPQIRFNTVLDNGPISQMLLMFDPSSTDGFDRAMDARSPNNGPANAYFSFDNKEYLIDVAPFEMDKKIAIGFRNKIQANYKITVNEMLKLDQVENVYLHDKIADSYHDIKNSFYDLTLPAGSNNNQYEITFKNTTLGVKDRENTSFIVNQDNAKKSFIINNPLFKDLVLCNLYDIAGKLIFSKSQLGNNSTYSFPTSSLGDGIYIVKLESSDKMEMGTKIIVKN